MYFLVFLLPFTLCYLVLLHNVNVCQPLVCKKYCVNIKKFSGNKVDLLPPDARCGYLKNFRSIVQKCIEEAGFLEKFNVLHTALISAKTGYGVEDLITVFIIYAC